MERLIKLAQTRSTSIEDGVTLELPKIPFEDEAKIDDALERCTTDPALKQAFEMIFFPQYSTISYFIYLFQIERISQFGASVLKDSVTSIVREVLSQKLRLTYCPQKAVNGKKSFKDSPLCKEIVLRKLMKKKERMSSYFFLFFSFVAAIRRRHPNPPAPAPPIDDVTIFKCMRQPFTGAADEKGGRALRSKVTARFKLLKQQAAQEVLEADNDI